MFLGVLGIVFVVITQVSSSHAAERYHRRGSATERDMAMQLLAAAAQEQAMMRAADHPTWQSYLNSNVPEVGISTGVRLRKGWKAKYEKKLPFKFAMPQGR